MVKITMSKDQFIQAVREVIARNVTPECSDTDCRVAVIAIQTLLGYLGAEE